ncbi:hypothetical protein PhCBS80983_g03156 [Powellomyces hirtus]|uniref:C2H2-type domain-containing protein n=1 Tax=Powellomyces hirtus TaxID=109895 RepID=A0A507E5K4_9FUNG|nr:hypothetical protein PhCBS80983_g03156 [Powellomyces hirtus]
MALSVDPPSSPPPPSPATSPPASKVDLPLGFTAKEALAAQALLFAQHSPTPPPPPRPPSHPCFSSSFADILAAAAAAAAAEAKADAEADAAAVHTASSCAPPPPSPPSPIIIIKTEPCDDASARAAAAMLVEACEFLDHPYAPSSPTGTTNVDCKREDGRIYACENDACGKTFMQLAHLRIHQICMYPGCTRSFTQLGNLKTHERKHTGEKPYKCSFLGCDKSFSQMGNMKTHELLHLGFKPYTCGIDGCDRAFSQLGNLKSHQQKVHINPVRRMSTLKRDSSPSGEEDVPHHLLQDRRNSDSTASMPDLDRGSARPSSDDAAFANFPGSRKRRGQTKEQKLLKKMKAVLERRHSEESVGLQLPVYNVPS